jgi:hypothetical protein
MITIWELWNNWQHFACLERFSHYEKTAEKSWLWESTNANGVFSEETDRVGKFIIRVYTLSDTEFRLKLPTLFVAINNTGLTWSVVIFSGLPTC